MGKQCCTSDNSVPRFVVIYKRTTKTMKNLHLTMNLFLIFIVSFILSFSHQIYQWTYSVDQ